MEGADPVVATIQCSSANNKSGVRLPAGGERTNWAIDGRQHPCFRCATKCPAANCRRNGKRVEGSAWRGDVWEIQAKQPSNELHDVRWRHDIFAWRPTSRNICACPRRTVDYDSSRGRQCSIADCDNKIAARRAGGNVFATWFVVAALPSLMPFGNWNDGFIRLQCGKIDNGCLDVKERDWVNDPAAG